MANSKQWWEVEDIATMTALMEEDLKRDAETKKVEVSPETARLFYEQIKAFALSKENVKYSKELYDIRDLYIKEEERAEYFTEDGYLEFQNEEGQTVAIKFSRFHAHRSNGYGCLNGNPCLFVTISIMGETIWELHVKHGTMYYEGWATEDKLPKMIDSALLSNNEGYQKILQPYHA